MVTASSNPIHAFLADVGLPFRSSRAQLSGWHRTGHHGWPDEVCVDTTRPALDGLLRPLSFHSVPQFDPRLPPGLFQGYVHTESDPVGDLEQVRRQLLPALGAPTAVDTSNTRAYRWRFGTASVQATCWPPELTRHQPPNRLHRRDPRLAVACNLAVRPGLRLTLTPAERGWLHRYEPIAALPVSSSAPELAHDPPEEYEAEFVREPQADHGRYANSIGAPELRRTHLLRRPTGRAALRGAALLRGAAPPAGPRRRWFLPARARRHRDTRVAAEADHHYRAPRPGRPG